MKDWLLETVRPMIEEDVRYFFVEKTDLLRNASREQLDYLQRVYPAYDFEKKILSAANLRPQEVMVA